MTKVRSHGGTVTLVAFDIGSLAVVYSWADLWSFGAIFFAVVLLSAYGAGHLYQNRLKVSWLDDLPSLVGRYLLSAGLVLLVVEAIPPDDDGGVAIAAWTAALVALLLMRSIGYALIRAARRRRVLGRRTLVVGLGHIGRSVVRAIKRERDCGLKVVGMAGILTPDIRPDLPAPLLGPVEDLPDLIEAHDIEFVIIGYTKLSEDELVNTVRECDRLPATIAIVPRLFELTPVGGTTDAISDIPLTRLRRPAFRSPLWKVKRVFDVTASGLAILVLSPLLLLIALVDRIVDGPGVIFRQERVGIDGRTFNVYKFRSMRPASTKESDTTWNIRNDDRVSWFGKLLRRSSLDELPQLFNIFKGDMSVVGPRPERPHFVEQFTALYPYYESRHRVPCGLTGLAQIQGLRGDTSIAGRARHDNFYIENWSPWLDIKIILRTVLSLTRGSG